jgi:glucose-6-phosphate 1-epimerase
MIEPVEVLGRPALRLVAADGAQATVMRHGAQIVSWVPAGDQERLYLSPTAATGPNDAVRGGIPVVFPQFSARGPLPKHGFARDRAWRWVEGAERGGVAIGVLALRHDAATRALWPHRFELELTLSVGGLELEIELAVANRGDAPFEFAAALHSYFRVDDLLRARLHGLHGARYLDALTDLEQRQEIDPQGFAGAIDRIYYDVAEPLALSSAFGRMAIAVDGGLTDAVVWNPGPQAALADLPAGDWQRFVCVESAAIGRPPRLDPGDPWVARLTLTA